MFRCLCPHLFLVLLCGFVHADVLLSTPLEDYIFATSSQTTEDPATTAVTSTTQAHVSISTDSTPASEATSKTSSSVASVTTEAPSTLQTNATVSPPTEPTNTTTEASTTLQTNATTTQQTVVTTELTNATTITPTNATTITPTNATTITPTNATTITPTNATTITPTNATTVSIPTTPVPTTAPVPNPSVGEYTVKAKSNSVCLKAKMGLQFKFNPGSTFQTINLDPNATISNGSCGSNGTDSTLILVADKMTVQFTFVNQTDKFHLDALNFSLDLGNGSIFSAEKRNLSLWEASLGSSYMCRKEQSYNISDNLLLNTFELQVQPFGITDDKFSTALECSMDDSSLLIPIIVGAALAGLIVIVVIAYMIGRRKTYVGYQTL